MEIYLIRHTGPQVAKGICYGQTDLNINEALFEEESQKIAALLPTDIHHCYASTLQRCQRLAKALYPAYETDDRLMEMNFGTWENSPWTDINQEELNPWMADFVHTPVPNGESYIDLYQRTQDFIDTLLDNPWPKVALVTHAGNIRAFISHALALPLEHSFRLHLDYAVLAVIELDRKEFNNKLVGLYNPNRMP